MSLQFDDPQTFDLLLSVCRKHAVSPAASIEAEVFFRELLSQYQGRSDPESIAVWLEERISDTFVSLDGEPKWLQEAEWPFAEGMPMIFVGQIDWRSRPDVKLSEVLHDDTSFYVFIGKKVKPAVVMQQM